MNFQLISDTTSGASRQSGATCSNVENRQVAKSFKQAERFQFHKDSEARPDQDTLQPQAFIEQMNADQLDAYNKLQQKEALQRHQFEEHLRKQQRAQAALQQLPFQGRQFSESFLRIFSSPIAKKSERD